MFSDARLLTEKEWQAQVADLAGMRAWLAYHTYDSRRSQPGFPDLVLVRDRILYLELKTDTGRLSDPQREWLTALLNADVEAYIVRPADAQLLADVLAARHRFDGPLLDRTRHELAIEVAA